MTTTVTVKGQVTLPKAVREAAGIRPGDRVSVRVRPEGGILVERDSTSEFRDAEQRKRRMIERAVSAVRADEVDRTMSTDDWMRLLRGED
ncbi:MAG TPA: AbrB/MazE/SpoVT family DNA-binding domain-containing protein [Roseiarcus sp.]|jgi:AbrB family looped-hinge helix DNA binding protein